MFGNVSCKAFDLFDVQQSLAGTETVHNLDLFFNQAVFWRHIATLSGRDSEAPEQISERVFRHVKELVNHCLACRHVAIDGRRNVQADFVAEFHFRILECGWLPHPIGYNDVTTTISSKHQQQVQLT